MHIHKITFRGYKAFPGDDDTAQSQVLTLCPLTIVFGKNNSGKSAVVRLPRLMLGGIECNDGRVLPVEVRGLRYGSSFLDLVHGGAFYARPEFSIYAEHDGDALDFTVILYSRGALTADEPPRVWSYKMRAPQQITVGRPSKSGDGTVNFAGLLPPDPRWNSWRKAAEGSLDRMIHLGPARAPVRPSYGNQPPAKLGLNGAEAPQLLRVDSALADAVGSWYHEHMEGWRLSVKRDSESFSLRVSKNSNLSTNLSQGGEGLQQVLPVVTHQYWRQLNTFDSFLDVVEQPELHLHAAAQAPLADLFIDTAMQGRGQVLVETNSEPILLRLQRRVAEGKLLPETVAIYYIETTEEGSILKRIYIDEAGEVDWWPAGVFEEDFSEVAAIRRAQRAREQHGAEL